ncbi:unnamed protein product [Oikopleura dioica]|uniref:Uncharacterized protein n=1 Tax=Oikopleura dioica TaxID=34765 RepID=E4YHF3_OIKDI|nr:unnamed protein product [Oikopleura dioica]
MVDYQKQAAVYPMNSLKLREVFSRSYMSSRGVRASLFNTRLGVYTRQLASKAQQCVTGEGAEARFRVIFESTTNMRYESFYREPGLHAGPLEMWTEMGAMYPIFELDVFGHYYVSDLRVWVKFDNWKLLSLSDHQLGHPARILSTLNAAPNCVYPWPSVKNDKFAVEKSKLLLVMGFTPVVVIPPYAEDAKKLIVNSKKSLVTLGIERELPHAPSAHQLDTLNLELENMLYRSFISSQHDLIHAPEENGEERSLDNKFAMFVTLMQEAFHKFLDGEETDPEFTDDPVSEAYQIVSKALPNEFKKLAPTVDLMRYLLGEISSICFTESTGLMHILGSSCIKKEIMAWQIWGQLPVEALIPEHPKTNKKFMEHLLAAKAKYNSENAENSAQNSSTPAAVAPVLE